MSDLTKVAEVGDLQPGECKTVAVGERELALFNVGGKFFVTDNVCTAPRRTVGRGDTRRQCRHLPLARLAVRCLHGAEPHDSHGEGREVRLRGRR